MEDWNINQTLSGVGPVGGGIYKERVWEGKYSRNIMYSCMKMEK
jgi:hypothetical protein